VLSESVERSRSEGRDIWEIGSDHAQTREIYFDFEAFLTAVNCSLDALARVVGTAYKEQTPPSFNKLCGKTHLAGCAQILRDAKRKWVQRLKDYRDCFIHYTPVDTLLMVVMREYPNGWEVRCKLPTNPNVREILRFRYARRTELLRYAITVWRNLMALDRRVALQIASDYETGAFPQRISNLFFIGARADSKTTRVVSRRDASGHVDAMPATASVDTVKSMTP
jgi:hypothetical protein